MHILDLLYFVAGMMAGAIISYLLYKRFDTLTALLVWHDVVRESLKGVLDTSLIDDVCYKVLIGGLRGNYLRHYDVHITIDTGYKDLDKFLSASLNNITHKGTMAGRLESLEFIIKAIKGDDANGKANEV